MVEIYLSKQAAEHDYLLFMVYYASHLNIDFICTKKEIEFRESKKKTGHGLTCVLSARTPHKFLVIQS